METFYDIIFNRTDNLVVEKEKASHKTALSTLTNSYTYGELKKEIKKYKSMLSEYGDLTGYRAALIIPSVFTYTALFIAINKLGGTIVPISHQFKNHDLTSVLELTKPHFIFTAQNNDHTEQIQLVKRWVDKEGKQVNFYFQENNQWKLNKSNGEKYEQDKEKIDVIGCSSGSTGAPKGIMINMNSWKSWINQIEKEFKLSEEDAIFSTFPLNSPYGIAWLLTSLKNGTKIIFPESFDVFKIINYLRNHHCNKIVATPSAYNSLNLFLQQGNRDVLERLDRIMISGEPVTPAFIESLKGMEHCMLTACYGISEQGILLVKKDMKELYKSGWDLVDGIEARIGHDDELVFKSPAVLNGYYKRSDLTKEVLEKGWYYTGDLGTRLENGNIQLIGRKKDMIKKGGQQVIPGEVEKVLAKHKHVKSVSIVGVPHPILGEKVVAFITGEVLVPHTELYNLCKREIARYKVPDEIYQLEELPMNQGKIDKLKLKKLAANSGASEAEQ
ncbi:acyl--CoA ligase [Domibacillus sp. PGB-M46]|uniref:class I adenylate-forming enzyme family protein n=1 Tax=Domibacillus sp. PGB-M46 TaxID=2910255 RepID=UPI001F562603|nr:class I adenylate-forming enzyme family protein [Domibacillus sp. PGB-M46]MCI2256047.1 acyl--CoA ligase [Domibacillus sp. PGB-M46]